MMNLLRKLTFGLTIWGVLAANTKAASSMVEVSYTSKTMNGSRKLMVYLPDGYANSTSLYPTFYLMHGGGQRYYTWANANDGNAKAILDQAVSSGKAKPMIVVMPDAPDFAPDLFTKELCNDVIPFVEKTYRVKTDKDSRALAGLSWGGLQVLDAGLYRYDLFGYLGVFSSGWFIGDNVYNVMNTYLAANGTKIEKSMRYLYFGQGGTGDIAYNNGRETMKVLRSHGITVNYWEHSGAHSFVCWRQDLRDFLPFLFQYGLNGNTNTPYKGVAHSVPGIIQAEEYDEGGAGVAYSEANANGNEGGAMFRNDEVDIETTEDATGSYNVGYVLKGEWLEYTVNVSTSGSYDLNLRLAADGLGKSLHVEMDGTDVTGPIVVPNTGGWQTWQTVKVDKIDLKAGTQVMRISFDSDYMNLNWLEFSKSTVTALQEDQEVAASIYPNPFGDEALTIKLAGVFNYRITDIAGCLMEEGVGYNSRVISSVLQPGIYLLVINNGVDTTIQKIVKK